jgi:chorismate mutase / prephenate dehydrogenase
MSKTPPAKGNNDEEAHGPAVAPDTLDDYRRRIRKVDDQILELVAKRLELAHTIGEAKKKRRLPIQDFKIEKNVIDRAAENCRKLGIDEDIGEAVMRPLIRHAVKIQEADRVRAASATGGKRVLIIGGAGLMGRWFADFLASQGHTITILDPAGPVGDYESATEVEDAVEQADVAIVATPPSVTSSILDDIGTTRTQAVIFDVCSLKTPIKGSLTSLAERGFQVASIHPMFGPDTDLLSGRHVIVCPLGHERAVQVIRSFFSETCASLVEMSLEEHDHLVAYVLGLSHAINILFNDVLSHSDERLDRVLQVSSTTFDQQFAVSSQLARENPDLYYEIQALNHYTPDLMEALERSLERFATSVARKDRGSFVAMMREAREYYKDVLGKDPEHIKGERGE